jgi:integrase
MANWRRTKTPGVYVAHSRRCPAFADEAGRCRCEPSWRGRRWNPISRRVEWQKPVTKDRSEVVSWLSATKKGTPHLRELVLQERSFEAIGDEWLAGVEAGRIGRRKGRGKAYSDTTVADYRRAYHNFVRPEFGPMVADEIGEVEWQMWVDRLSREGLSRSRISTLVAIASAIYAWAMTPARRYVARNPLRLVELPPNDEEPRLRVAFAAEAEELLAALEPEDALPYAIAFYAGLRRSEIHRLQWPDVLAGGKIASRLLVARAKTEAGTERLPPIAEPLRDVLRRAWLRQGRPETGRVIERSVMSWRLVQRASKAWDHAGLRRITLHECRHTYASLLMAAGYTLKELMEFIGHADLQMVNRYVKLLPQPGEDDTAARLNDYLRRAQRSASETRDG